MESNLSPLIHDYMGKHQRKIYYANYTELISLASGTKQILALEQKNAKPPSHVRN